MSHVEYIVETDNSGLPWFDIVWAAFTITSVAGCIYYFYIGRHKKKKQLTL